MRSAELCAGYGGLALAIEKVFDAETAWVSEFEEAPSKILAHHWPDAPNYGDMTKIDWYGVEPVDVLGAGTPCQDLSTAGRRKGMTEGTRSNLWVHMREAIAIIKPTYVVWENVRGAYSACADSEIDSELGRCPRCLDPNSGAGHAPNLRALGRVLGDLSDLGYDTQWRGLRASDLGSCHGRFRVFVLARRRDAGDTNVTDVEGRGTAGRGNTDPQQSPGVDRSASDGHRAASVQDADISTGGERRISAPGQTQGGRAWADAGGRDRTPPAKGNGYVSNTTPWWAESEAAPDADRGNDDGRLGDAQRSQEWGEAAAGRGEGSLANTEGERRGEGWTESERLKRRFDAPLGSDTNWGEYEPAIRRWERVLGRRAPRPTEPTGRNGGHRLSPRFTEWMMGLPDGWVTDPAIGISRNEQLKACGNGVVPQQAVAALSDMLAAFGELEAAA